MPKEGHTSVTFKTYKVERIEKYFNDHEAELRKKGIKSASALMDCWLDEKLIEASKSELYYSRTKSHRGSIDRS